MTGAYRFYQNGGPEVLQWETVDVPPPGPGEVTLRQEAIGLNFTDIYARSGLYPSPLPSGLGQEAAGIVTAVGEGVTEVALGDRVAYAGGPLGAYAEARNISAQLLLKLPEGISSNVAASMLLRGLTVQYLLRQTYKVQAGDTVLIHAAAGGVGLIAAQWAKALGAFVIGTVGVRSKVALAQSHGCDHVLVLGEGNLAQEVKALTGGEGVAVVYDAIGKDTFFDSLDCLRPLGMMVTYGNASGPVPLFSPLELSKRGSLFLTRPTLTTYTRKRELLLPMAEELFAMILSGKVKIEIGQTYALRDVPQAQRDLAERRTTGSTVLLP
ncbi:MAG TPA: quinone oxidoreductase [Rhodocyclaceae bacterium]|jgi:NADPH2:quinone reductase